MALLEKMSAAGIPKSVRAYGGAICACDRAGEWARALEILSEMKGGEAQDAGAEPGE